MQRKNVRAKFQLSSKIKLKTELWRVSRQRINNKGGTLDSDLIVGNKTYRAASLMSMIVFKTNFVIHFQFMVWGKERCVSQPYVTCLPLGSTLKKASNQKHN